MSGVTVCDLATGRAGAGLYISKAGVCWWRHNVRPHRAGLWEIYVSLTNAMLDVLDWPDTTRPAVVDDFGTLVIVGEPL